MALGLVAFLVSGAVGGRPSCSSTGVMATVKQLFNDMPVIQNWGVQGLQVQNPVETNASGGIRTCRARVITSGGGNFGVAYTIQQRGFQYYVQVQPALP